MSAIRAWLEAQGLAKHADLFEANDIGTDILTELEEADLKDLGLSLGDRKRVMAALRKAQQDEATPAPSPRVAARRQVTVLFADLSGFTQLSNRLDAEEVHALLQRFFAEVDDAVRAYGGSIDKHIGDAVMAVFGAPVAHSDDPERAVRCALDIHQRLSVFEPPQQSHIGIASGQVVASETGSSAFTEYTVTGASVNLASRLQDQAKGGETLISDEVRRAIGGRLQSEAVGDLTVKGMEAPVTTWRVTGFSAGSSGENRQPFVGRERELANLEALLRVCRDRQKGQIAILRGEPGIGKSRLGDHLEEVAQNLGFAQHSALILDFGTDRGREALPALLRSLLSLDAASTAAVRDAAIVDALGRGLLAQEDRVHLYDLLDLPQPTELMGLNQAMDTRTRSRGQARTLANLALALASVQPLFLRIEDVHWAESELLSQLAILAAAGAEAAIFLLLSTRVEADPLDTAWQTSTGLMPVTALTLGPLPEAAAFSLARSYQIAEEGFARSCIERAAGNPLFLDQLLRMVGQSVEQGIPGSVQSIVQSRMDRLNTDERAALEAASVLGQRFAEPALAALLESNDARCQPLLAQGLIKPEGDGFLFTHALVRDGVYATLLQERRRSLHAKAAAWFHDRDASLHARHLGAAEDPVAATAFLEAARQEIERHRLRPALRLLEEGLALPADRARRFHLTTAKGEALRNLGDSQASLGCFAEAMALAEGKSQRAECHLGSAAAMRILDRFDEAFAALEQAEALFDPERDKLRLTALWSLRGNLLFPLGRPEECRHAHGRALELARDAEATAAEVQALGGLGDAFYADGRLEDAQRHFADCVRLARKHALGQIEVANAPMLAWSTLLVGNYRDGAAEAASARENALAAGNERAAIIALNAMATATSDSGDMAAAEAHSQEIVRLSERLRSGRFKSYGLNLLAELSFYRGDLVAAKALADRAWEEAQTSAVGFCGPWILGIRARIQGDCEAARADLAQAGEILAAGAVAHNHFFFRRHAMEFALEQGDSEELERQAQAFEAYLDDHGTPWSDLFLRRARLLSEGDSGSQAERAKILQRTQSEGLAIWARALEG